MFTDEEVTEIHTKYPRFSWRIDLGFDTASMPDAELSEYSFKCSGRKLSIAKHPDQNIERYTFYKLDEA